MKLFSVLQTKKGFTIALLTILLLSAVLRFYRLSIPSGYYFDEVYHALTSKLISRDDVRAYEWWNEPVEPDTAVDWLHPPLAKYTQAASIRVFGENSFGWRFSSALFGVFVIAATALVAQISFKRKFITLFATLLVATDGLLFAQSRIAMNDIHVTLFILLTAGAYIWYRQKTRENHHDTKQTFRHLLLIGLLAGIAMGTKWSGIFVLGAVYMFEGLLVLSRKYSSISSWIQALGLRAITLICIPICIYVLSYSHMFIQGKTLICTGDSVVQGQCFCSQESSTWVIWLSKLMPAKQSYFESLEARGGCKRLISHFSELHNQIWWYQTNLKATHPYESRPWQWALDLKPVWMHVDYESTSGKIANVYNAGNPVLFWIGLVTSSTVGIGILLKIAKNVNIFLFAEKKNTYTAIPLEVSFLVTLYALVWIPWSLSPRIMFFYHYAPAVPLLSILISYAVTKIPASAKSRHYIGIGIAALCLVTFVLLFPIFSGYPMKQTYFDAVFTVFPSWK